MGCCGGGLAVLLWASARQMLFLLVVTLAVATACRQSWANELMRFQHALRASCLPSTLPLGQHGEPCRLTCAAYRLADMQPEQLKDPPSLTAEWRAVPHAGQRGALPLLPLPRPGKCIGNAHLCMFLG